MLTIECIVKPGKSIRWLNTKQQPHRNNNYAYLGVGKVYSVKRWYRLGKLHNIDGPAHIEESMFGRELGFWVDGLLRTTSFKEWKKL